MNTSHYLRMTGRPDLVLRAAPKPFLQMTRRDHLAHELDKAADDDIAAEEDAAAGLHDCAEFRRNLARLRREDSRSKGAVLLGLMPRAKKRPASRAHPIPSAKADAPAP